MDLSSEQQAEVIADQFAKISNLYQPLQTEDIKIPVNANSNQFPCLTLSSSMKKYAKQKRSPLLSVEIYHGESSQNTQ